MVGPHAFSLGLAMIVCGISLVSLQVGAKVPIGDQAFWSSVAYVGFGLAGSIVFVNVIVDRVHQRNLRRRATGPLRRAERLLVSSRNALEQVLQRLAGSEDSLQVLVYGDGNLSERIALVFPQQNLIPPIYRTEVERFANQFAEQAQALLEEVARLEVILQYQALNPLNAIVLRYQSEAAALRAAIPLTPWGTPGPASEDVIRRIIELIKELVSVSERVVALRKGVE